MKQIPCVETRHDKRDDSFFTATCISLAVCKSIGVFRHTINRGSKQTQAILSDPVQ